MYTIIIHIFSHVLCTNMFAVSTCISPPPYANTSRQEEKFPFEPKTSEEFIDSVMNTQTLNMRTI